MISVIKPDVKHVEQFPLSGNIDKISPSRMYNYIYDKYNKYLGIKSIENLDVKYNYTDISSFTEEAFKKLLRGRIIIPLVARVKAVNNSNFIDVNINVADVVNGKIDSDETYKFVYKNAIKPLNNLNIQIDEKDFKNIKMIIQEKIEMVTINDLAKLKDLVAQYSDHELYNNFTYSVKKEENQFIPYDLLGTTVYAFVPDLNKNFFVDDKIPVVYAVLRKKVTERMKALLEKNKRYDASVVEAFENIDEDQKIYKRAKINYFVQGNKPKSLMINRRITAGDLYKYAGNNVDIYKLTPDLKVIDNKQKIPSDKPNEIIDLKNGPDQAIATYFFVPKLKLRIRLYGKKAQ